MDRKILVPTDFSDCANNALNYALGLAKDLQAEIIIMHSILYKDSPFKGDGSKEKKNTDSYNDATARLDETLRLAQTREPALKIRSLLEGGSPDLSISAVIDSEKIDYIVMGTEGASGMKAAVMGSFTSVVISFSRCPVFVIPIEGRYKGIKNIVAATQFDASEMKAVAQLLLLAGAFTASITFYNVDSDEKAQKNKGDQFTKALQSVYDYPSALIVMENSDDIVHSIDTYVCNTLPDLVVTLGKERSFFEKLFGKRVTKRICLHTSVPLLSFPQASAH